eukprot:389271-Amphidinium_carterae.1
MTIVSSPRFTEVGQSRIVKRYQDIGIVKGVIVLIIAELVVNVVLDCHCDLRVEDCHSAAQVHVPIANTHCHTTVHHDIVILIVPLVE